MYCDPSAAVSSAANVFGRAVDPSGPMYVAMLPWLPAMIANPPFVTLTGLVAAANALPVTTGNVPATGTFSIRYPLVTPDATLPEMTISRPPPPSLKNARNVCPVVVNALPVTEMPRPVLAWTGFHTTAAAVDIAASADVASSVLPVTAPLEHDSR